MMLHKNNPYFFLPITFVIESEYMVYHKFSHLTLDNLKQLFSLDGQFTSISYVSLGVSGEAR